MHNRKGNKMQVGQTVAVLVEKRPKVFRVVQGTLVSLETTSIPEEERDMHGIVELFVNYIDDTEGTYRDTYPLEAVYESVPDFSQRIAL